MPTLPAWRLLLLGALLIGSLDLLFAWGFWVAKGVSFVDVLHSIAAGWYGKASRNSGVAGAVVGAVSHYAIVLAFVLAYWWAAQRIPALLRHWMALGAGYGAGLYGVMNFVVLPMSAAGAPSFANRAWVASSIAMHVLVGVLCAWTVRKAVHAQELS